jgi:small GTP-binding protein
MVTKKVILTGVFGVGKTSLFNRFVFQKFDEKYLTTIGVKVDKKVIHVNNTDFTYLLWDIAGEVTQDKIPHAYFLGTSGILYVVDLSRPNTFKQMETDIQYLKTHVASSLIKIVGNKKDLLTPEKLDEVLQIIPLKPDILTSAKTGENVEELFHSFAKELLQ